MQALERLKTHSPAYVSLTVPRGFVIIAKGLSWNGMIEPGRASESKWR